ncbi:SRPBCC family protein [Streptomyces sp. NPDC006739]|uniref:SRPBCC family protein n=1 Tax=Streptomyces sp. NPDC006739 TaxID=3364763 RepID=UPI0036B60BD4
MSSKRAHTAELTVPVAAPAGVVYGLLADAVHWPVLLPSYVHVERMDHDGSQELLRVWDLADGRVRPLLVRRWLRPQSRTVESVRTDPKVPGAATRGSWSVTPADGGGSLLTLRRERPAQAGPEPELATAQQAVEAEVRTRLTEVKAAAERWELLDELLLAFEDSVRVSGPAELVYDFLYRVRDWADLLPHVERTDVTEESPGVQVADLETCGWDGGGTITSRAVRLCFPSAGRIVHKDVVPPELLLGHTGEWSLVPDETGVTVVCSHAVMLRQEAVEPLLGAGATLADARHEVRAGLGQASSEALALAKWYAESALRQVG